MTPAIEDLHPAQNRAFRELYAASRQLVNHYRSLGELIEEDALLEGAAVARRLLDDLRSQTRRYDLHGYPAAQNVGATAARTRSGVGEQFLERNQALRFAVLDAQHVVTLLGYLAAVSETNGNDDLADFCRRWEAAMLEVEQHIRAAAVDQGSRPDEAVEPLHDSHVGRAAHGLAQGIIGGLGEWFDRRAARRRG
jgi:hypothetical protein